MPPPADRLAPLQQMIAAGRAEQARAALARLLQRSPRDPEACATMAAALAGLGQREQAAFYADRAMEAAGGSPARLAATADLLARLGLEDAAAAAHGAAAARNPADGMIQLARLNFLLGSGRLVDAVEAGTAAVAACPAVPELRLILAFAQMGLARAADAQATLAEAAARFPDHPGVATARAASANYLDDADPAAVLELHRAYGRLLERIEPASTPAWNIDFDPARRLRVAVISPDFRTHSISYFIEALFSHADPAQVELVGVSTVGYEDPTTARLRALTERSGGWRCWPDLPGRDLADRLRRERLDVAVDIAGHSFRHSLAALHHRAAPVQVTYMGYPNTTGVGAVDARIVDSTTDPPGADAFAVERLVRIDPCFLCYTPPSDAPDPDPVPPSLRPPTATPGAAADGCITFGSFNNLSKLNDVTLRTWARALRAVPGSRLALKNLALGNPRVREDLLRRLVAAGIDRERVDLLPPGADTASHLSAYSRIDAALDTYPYCGTTTTCEAMHMGVPVVSRAGRTHASRVGLTLLKAVGLEGLCAPDEDGFVQAAARLAVDRARLADLRRTLRARLAASPLRDGPAFASRFIDALRGLWRARCAAERR
jgi:predicted O-linked N-acetylglucosamine transferase (SPINDLY family)